MAPGSREGSRSGPGTTVLQLIPGSPPPPRRIRARCTTTLTAMRALPSTDHFNSIASRPPQPNGKPSLRGIVTSSSHRTPLRKSDLDRTLSRAPTVRFTLTGPSLVQRRVRVRASISRYTSTCQFAPWRRCSNSMQRAHRPMEDPAILGWTSPATAVTLQSSGRRCSVLQRRHDQRVLRSILPQRRRSTSRWAQVASRIFPPESRCRPR